MHLKNMCLYHLIYDVLQKIQYFDLSAKKLFSKMKLSLVSVKHNPAERIINTAIFICGNESRVI